MLDTVLFKVGSPTNRAGYAGRWLHLESQMALVANRVMISGVVRIISHIWRLLSKPWKGFGSDTLRVGNAVN